MPDTRPKLPVDAHPAPQSEADPVGGSESRSIPTSRDVVLVERMGAVTTITLNRPQVRNAVDRSTAEALANAFRGFDEDPDAAVAVLTGAGGTFCSGADLGAIAAGRPNRLEPTGDGPMGPTRMTLTKPVIAAISGYAVAGGLELALWCDLRIVEEDAVFGVFCRRWGVPLIDGGTVRLPRLVGLGVAMDLVLTGREVQAAEARTIGLATRVVPTGTSLAVAQELGKVLADLPQTAMRGDRLSMLGSLGRPESEGLAREWECGAVSLSGEAIAGADRFVASNESRR